MSVNEFLSKLKKEFPDSKIETEDDGWSSYAFTIDNDKIVRIPKKNIDGYKKEEKILHYLKDKISFEIPEVKVVEKINFSYALHKKLNGKKWDEETFKNLSKKEKNLFCFDIAKFLSEIHSVNIKEASKITDLTSIHIPNKKSFEYLEEFFSKDEIFILKDVVEKLDNSPIDAVLIHDDFQKTNSLVNENHRLKGIFDFNNVCIDDRYFDFTHIYNKDYLELLNITISHYKKLTGIEISLEKVKRFNLRSCVYNLAYLKETSTTERIIAENNWIIKEIRDFLQERNLKIKHMKEYEYDR